MTHDSESREGMVSGSNCGSLISISRREGDGIEEGLPEMHAPNEKFHLPVFYHGTAASIWFLAEVGASRDRGTKQRREVSERTTALA
jgi:hypothetical protein